MCSLSHLSLGLMTWQRQNYGNLTIKFYVWLSYFCGFLISHTAISILICWALFSCCANIYPGPVKRIWLNPELYWVGQSSPPKSERVSGGVHIAWHNLIMWSWSSINNFWPLLPHFIFSNPSILSVIPQWKTAMLFLLQELSS